MMSKDRENKLLMSDHINFQPNEFQRTANQLSHEAVELENIMQSIQNKVRMIASLSSNTSTNTAELMKRWNSETANVHDIPSTMNRRLQQVKELHLELDTNLAHAFSFSDAELSRIPLKPLSNPTQLRIRILEEPLRSKSLNNPLGTNRTFDQILAYCKKPFC